MNRSYRLERLYANILNLDAAIPGHRIAWVEISQLGKPRPKPGLIMETAAGSRPPVTAGAADERLLRRDVRLLCWELARMVREHGTGELLDLADGLLRLAQQRREGDPRAAAAMEQRLAGLDVCQLQQLVRMEGCYLELMNLAEDRHRARVLRQRDDAAFPAPRGESIGAAVDTLCAAGVSPQQVQELLDQARHLPRLHGPPHRGQTRDVAPRCWAACGKPCNRSIAATCSAASARNCCSGCKAT